MGIPSYWQNEKLGSLATQITKGTTPTTAGFQYQPEGVPFIKVENIIDGQVALKSVTQFISPEAHSSLKRSQFQVGDVLFSIAGTIGKTALVDESNVPANTNQAVAIIRGVTGCFIPSFLKLQLQEAARRIQVDHARGGAMNNVSLADLKGVTVSVPPLAEQKVIADKLDTLLAQVENTKARLERIPQILKCFRQSVLAAAASGRLIDAQPESIASLEELVDIENGARKPVSAAIRKTIQGTIPYYGATGIVDYLNGYTHEGRYLLVGEDGANLLSKSKDLAFMVKGKMWVNNHAHVLRERPGVNLDFVKIAINSLDLTPWITGSAQPKLTKKSLCSLPIANFTLNEQTEIVRRVDQLFAHADRIEQQVNNALARVNNLTQSILAKAFRGELTEQWRKDNPELISGENSAEALLERIKAERATKPAKKTRTGKKI